MTLKRRIEKLEQRAVDNDRTVEILLQGRRAVAEGTTFPQKMQMAELEELALRYPNSMWPRLLQARQQVGGYR